MAFNNVGAIVNLNAGQSADWFYQRNGFQDFGTQFASADVKTPNQGAVHVADRQRKQKLSDGRTTYFVRIINEGPGSCFHNLQGGGVS